LGIFNTFQNIIFLLKFLESIVVKLNYIIVVDSVRKLVETVAPTLLIENMSGIQHVSVSMSKFTYIESCHFLKLLLVLIC